MFFAGFAKSRLKVHKPGADDLPACVNLMICREVISRGSWVDNEAVVDEYVTNGVVT
jgi:hypothetical protein